MMDKIADKSERIIKLDKLIRERIGESAEAGRALDSDDITAEILEMAKANDTSDEQASRFSVDALVIGNLKGKVLMHAGAIVNELMLDKGIYETDKPTVHWRSDLTMEKFVEEIRVFDEAFNDGKSTDYYENLQKCRFVDVTLKINQ